MIGIGIADHHVIGINQSDRKQTASIIVESGIQTGTGMSELIHQILRQACTSTTGVRGDGIVFAADRNYPAIAIGDRIREVDTRRAIPAIGLTHRGLANVLHSGNTRQHIGSHVKGVNIFVVRAGSLNCNMRHGVVN